jgi:hypothetical protein
MQMTRRQGTALPYSRHWSRRPIADFWSGLLCMALCLYPLAWAQAADIVTDPLPSPPTG